MSFDKKMLHAACKAALRDEGRGKDVRGFLIGSVGLRNDGVIVSSRNIPSVDLAPNHHAEARLCRMLTPGSTVWVARVLRATRQWAIARPCPGCQVRLKAVGVKKVIYTISHDEWGTLSL